MEVVSDELYSHVISNQIKIRQIIPRCFTLVSHYWIHLCIVFGATSRVFYTRLPLALRAAPYSSYMTLFITRKVALDSIDLMHQKSELDFIAGNGESSFNELEYLIQTRLMKPTGSSEQV